MKKQAIIYKAKIPRQVNCRGILKGRLLLVLLLGCESLENIAAGEIDSAAIDQKMFEAELYTAGLPPVDFMIRTSGEIRLSNFLLYQLAYAEFYQTDVLWPDFDQHAYEEALLAYTKRNRRFGGV